MKRTFTGVRRAVVAVLVLLVLLSAAPPGVYAAMLLDQAGPWCVERAHVLTVTAPVSGIVPRLTSFDPTIKLVSVLGENTLGLPGDPIDWIVTIANEGTASGPQVVVTDTLRDELRVDSVETERGSVAVSGQAVVWTVSSLQPGESLSLTIHTTVLRSPSNGVLLNEALLAAEGLGGAITRKAAAEVFVPTGLPATGYPPIEDLPGQGEPSVLQVALAAVGVVMLTAVFVWYRGRRSYRF